MSLVTFSDVNRFYGRQDVLTGVTLAIEPGDRIGLVGRNGAGKTTIIRLIMEEEQPDRGQVVRARGLRIGYLPQEILTQPGKRLLELVLDTDPEYRRVEASLKQMEAELAALQDSPRPEDEVMDMVERHGALLHEFERLGGWEKESAAKKILSGLGFLETDLERDLSEFSGGWIMRAVLARLLLARPDLLILDEPTNHLDLDSLIWLEAYLKGTPSALLLVSHDRVFLNNLATKVIELRNGKADLYPGNYEQFLEAKDMRLQTEASAFQNQQAQIKQMEKFIERNRARASTARRAQSRVKAIDKMDRLAAPDSGLDPKFILSLPVGRRGPDMVAELKNVSKIYGDIEVFTDLNLTLRRGDRLALVGPNGRGKSTLIKMMAGAVAPTSGDTRLGQSVDLGYFSQFQMDSLDASRTVLEEFAASSAGMTPGSQRTLLAGFLFQGEDVFKKVKVLSGGEKTRLVLAKIMMGAPNLLLLDEPTNHLDITGRQMLEEALASYQGTMVIISHDRHFINRLATSVGIIENGGLTVYPGDYDDYRDIWLQKMEEAQAAGSLPPAPDAADARAPSTKAPSLKAASQKSRSQDMDRLDAGVSARRKGAQKAVGRAAERQRAELRKAMVETESRLDGIARRLGELDKVLSGHEVYKDRSRMSEILNEQADLKKAMAAVEKVYERQMTDLERLDRPDG
ncbi:MAG: ATP-binding cassette domain-containing protein [Deltaproteobacteria bacterium]|jgi:ATP-binding cassette subfamily F protein 3|nr:ATP-binding cassette domain-containing protein [Deltaproteobacteria bacterium]